MEAVLDSGGYLGMPFPTIKHNNMSGYEKSQHANRADPRNPHQQLQGYGIPIHLEIHEERGSKKL